MFLEYNQLKFSIYKEIVSSDGLSMINPVWGKILSDYIVLLNIKIDEQIVKSEYFIIENPNITYDQIDSLTFDCLSYESLFLNNTNLHGFRDAVKRLYDPSGSIGTDGKPHGILNYILQQKFNNCWTLAHIDNSVLDRERVLSFTGNNLKYVFDTLEESFNCVFVFDNVNMSISVYERQVGMLGSNRGLVISDDNYATKFVYTEDTKGITTRVTVFGKNQSTIAKYNPTGQLHVDNLDFYANLQYMSQGTINAWNLYKNLVASKAGLFESYIDNLDAGDTSVEPLIEGLIAELSWENNFTSTQIKELTPFIKEETVTINTISDGRELYKYALRYLNTVSFIPIQITIDVTDIFALEDGKDDWSKLQIGDFINIYRNKYELEYVEMRLVSYEHNPVSNSLRLEFSNKDELITMKWLNNMFFKSLEDMETTFHFEQDLYLAPPDIENLTTEITNTIVTENIITNTIISRQVITNNLFAENGDIANLTVNRLRTDYMKAWLYLAGDTSPINFQEMVNERRTLTTANVVYENDVPQVEQHRDMDGLPLWWMDEIGGKMSTNPGETGDEIAMPQHMVIKDTIVVNNSNINNASIIIPGTCSENDYLVLFVHSNYRMSSITGLSFTNIYYPSSTSYRSLYVGYRKAISTDVGKTINFTFAAAEPIYIVFYVVDGNSVLGLSGGAGDGATSAVNRSIAYTFSPNQQALITATNRQNATLSFNQGQEFKRESAINGGVFIAATTESPTSPVAITGGGSTGSTLGFVVFDVAPLSTRHPVMVYKYKETVKRFDGFREVTMANGQTTVAPVVIDGAGTGIDETSGQLHFVKDIYGPKWTYYAGQGSDTQAVMEARNDGKWYFNDVEVGTGGGAIIHYIDHLPTQNEIYGWNVGDRVSVYDPTNPFIPN